MKIQISILNNVESIGLLMDYEYNDNFNILTSIIVTYHTIHIEVE